MKDENEGIELSVIKGILGLSSTSLSLYHKRSMCLEHLSYYNNFKTKYNLDKISFVSIGFGDVVYGVKKNGNAIKLRGRR